MADKSKAIKAVRGMQDQFGTDLVLWKTVESQIIKVLEAFGYQEIRTPVLEHQEVFTQTVGTDTEIVEKQMYQIQERAPAPDVPPSSSKSESLVLRPEGTSAFIRAVIEHGLHLHGGPGRYYYNLSMFRHERPQKGRLRQFHQFGAELIQASAPEADAESIVLLDAIYKSLGLTQYVIRLNTLGDKAARESYRKALVEYFSPFMSTLDETAQKKFQRAPLRILDSKDEKIIELAKKAPKITDHLSAQSRAHYETVKKRLTEAGIAFVEDPTIVRGLDYYSETTFEFTSDLLGAQSALGAGGRYDGLSERFGVDPFPAIGWALGMERVMLALTEAKKLGAPAVSKSVYLAPLGEKAFDVLFSLSVNLKRVGITAVMSYEKEKALKWQLKQADRIGANYCIMVGDNEMASQSAVLKNLRTGDQETVLWKNIEIELQRRL